jgi:hypothetical protein
LGNIGFCRPDALVIELFHPYHNDLCYLALAESAGLRHQIFVGQTVNDAKDQNESQWMVNVDAQISYVQGAIRETVQ